MKILQNLGTVKLHTKILVVALGLLIVACIVMVVRQYTGNTIDQYRQKTQVTFEIGSGSKDPSLSVEIADTPYKQQYGLMFRGQLEWGDGMIFVFDEEKVRSFRMKNTYIPLDMIFVNASGQVVSMYHGAKPTDETPVSSIYPAKYVIEANSGWMIEAKITTGTMIYIGEDENDQ